ncbi:unnamed protein product [Paramecium sonneborni]|uniref:Transmembrane protein n=1 Tax=Paramecium sonneborni TaxID=65129 RepID=A0A8S1RTI4_9CILI|nr:unnamed protein product [Paramecium sonneborni]
MFSITFQYVMHILLNIFKIFYKRKPKQLNMQLIKQRNFNLNQNFIVKLSNVHKLIIEKVINFCLTQIQVNNNNNNQFANSQIVIIIQKFKSINFRIFE